MTNLEIDKALALAIGWREDQITTDHLGLSLNLSKYMGLVIWRRFSHLDPAVIWRVAERFNAFPQLIGDGRWYTLAQVDGVFQMSVTHPIAATAVALAVIEGVKK